jgi:hypothetical protein
VLGETEIGAVAFLGSLGLALFTAHQIGRSGVERPSGGASIDATPAPRPPTLRAAALTALHRTRCPRASGGRPLGAPGKANGR